MADGSVKLSAEDWLIKDWEDLMYGKIDLPMGCILYLETTLNRLGFLFDEFIATQGYDDYLAMALYRWDTRGEG